MFWTYHLRKLLCFLFTLKLDLDCLIELFNTYFVESHTINFAFFKASALWADAFYKSKCSSVCSLLRYHLNVFLPPLPEVGCPIFLESLGKSSGKKWSHIWTFLFENCLKSPRKKKKCFLADFALQNMVETTLTDGLETSGRRGYR